MSENKKRILWIDIAKGFSIILVVYGHCGLSTVPYLGDWFTAFRMPFFFLVSGLLFNPDKYSTLYSFMRKKWPTLIRPFILFSLTVFAGLYFISPLQFHHQIEHFFRIGWGGYALWFIPVLLLTEILFLLICKMVSLVSIRMLIVGALALVGFVLYKMNISNYWNVNFVLTAVLFFGIGNSLCRPLNTFMESKPFRNMFAYIILCFLISLSTFLNTSPPEYFINSLGGVFTYFAALSGAFMLCFFANMISRISSVYISPLVFIFKYFGKNSYVVLAFHQIIAQALSSIFLITSGTVVRLTMWVILIVLIEGLTRFLPWVLGRS